MLWKIPKYRFRIRSCRHKSLLNIHEDNNNFSSSYLIFYNLFSELVLLKSLKINNVNKILSIFLKDFFYLLGFIKSKVHHGPRMYERFCCSIFKIAITCYRAISEWYLDQAILRTFQFHFHFQASESLQKTILDPSVELR